MFIKSAFSGTLDSWKKPYAVWPYSEGGLYRGKQVKMRSLGWVLIQYGWCPYKGEKFGYRDMCRGSQWEDTERREPSTCQGERPGAAPPLQPPDRTLIWDSGLQNWEMIHFCCFPAPLCGTLFYKSLSKPTEKETIPSALWGRLFGESESPKRDRPFTSLSR